ncbi:uncharacterized protein LOC132613125 [Lycium barbarum]|uniref:uncharacterized protein LOC132613125 n=1 Tax=Lycium barbarum TaxID=112863 RepID=UPI00293E95AD|nr:uncharacterized protein LOC132613125 [Lycium barbarum]
MKKEEVDCALSGNRTAERLGFKPINAGGGRWFMIVYVVKFFFLVWFTDDKETDCFVLIGLPIYSKPAGLVCGPCIIALLAAFFHILSYAEKRFKNLQKSIQSLPPSQHVVQPVPTTGSSSPPDTTPEVTSRLAPSCQGTRYQAPSFQAISQSTPSFSATRQRTPSFQFTRQQVPSFQAPSVPTPSFQATSLPTPLFQSTRCQAPSFQATSQPSASQATSVSLAPPQETFNKRKRESTHHWTVDAVVGWTTREVYPMILLTGTCSWSLMKTLNKLCMFSSFNASTLPSHFLILSASAACIKQLLASEFGTELCQV